MTDDPAPVTGTVTRIWLRPHRATRQQAPGTVSAFSFQRWLGESKKLRDQGHDVTVVVARDGSHAVRIVAYDTTKRGRC